VSLGPGLGPATPPGAFFEERYAHLPPWIYPPRGARPVDRTQNSAEIQPGDSGLVLEIEVETGFQLTLLQAGFGAPDPTPLSQSTWSVRINGEVMSGYGFLPCAIGTVDRPADVIIVVPGPAKVGIYATNTFLRSAWVYTARVRGWMYAERRT
jgi:hypothetical protein